MSVKIYVDNTFFFNDINNDFGFNLIYNRIKFKFPYFKSRYIQLEINNTLYTIEKDESCPIIRLYNSIQLVKDLEIIFSNRNTNDINYIYNQQNQLLLKNNNNPINIIHINLEMNQYAMNNSLKKPYLKIINYFLNENHIEKKVVKATRTNTDDENRSSVDIYSKYPTPTDHLYFDYCEALHHNSRPFLLSYTRGKQSCLVKVN